MSTVTLMSRPTRRFSPSGLPAMLLLVCGLLLTLPGAWSPAMASPTDEEIRAAVEDVLSNGRFQTELPNEALPEEAEVEPETDWRFDLPDGIIGLAKVLMWLLVGAGGLLLVIFIVNELSSFRLRPRGSLSQPSDSPLPAGGAKDVNGGSGLSLEEADRLAREGRYAEALHTLLLDCFAQLRRLRFDAVLAPSLTSREVARRLSLPEQSKQALSAIVSAVELSHFGGRMPGEDDYRQCRESYLRIAHDSAEAAS